MELYICIEVQCIRCLSLEHCCFHIYSTLQYILRICIHYAHITSYYIILHHITHVIIHITKGTVKKILDSQAPSRPSSAGALRKAAQAGGMVPWWTPTIWNGEQPVNNHLLTISTIGLPIGLPIGWPIFFKNLPVVKDLMYLSCSQMLSCERTKWGTNRVMIGNDQPAALALWRPILYLFSLWIT